MTFSKRIFYSLPVLLAACAGVPELPAGAEAGGAALPAAAEIDKGLEANWNDVLAEGAAAQDWLQTLDDPELDDLVAEALRHNSDPRQASANLKTAERLAAQAGTALEAAIAGPGATAATGHDDAPAGNFGATRNLQWEIDAWDRLDAIEAGAEKSARASRTDLEAARLSLVAQTAKAWFLAAETNLQLALSQQAVEIHARALQVVRDRVATGTVTANIAEAETNLQAARERQRLAIGALVQALRSFKIVLGRYPSAELLELREIVPVPTPVPAGLPAALLERRPDLVSARRRVAAAFKHRQAEAAAALPRLPLTSSDGGISSELSRLLGAGSTFFSRGENFLVDAGNGGAQGTIAAMGTRQQTALEQYAAVAQQALAEVASHLDRDARLRRRAAALGASADAIAGMPAVANRRADAGDGEPSQALRLEAKALATRIRLVRTGYARLAQRVDLYLALGGGFGR